MTINILNIGMYLLQAVQIDNFANRAMWGDGQNLNGLVFYHDMIKGILLQLCTLIGMTGSLRIYIKWHSGEPVIGLIRGWGLAILFAVIVTSGFLLWTFLPGL